ncbi:MAG: hypothetical protein WEB06_17605 [Actinomycetota bacterium]
MARLSVKSTFSLDLRTIRALERISTRWRVSKSEALRRAVLIAEQASEGGTPDALLALDELQRSLGMTPARAREWTRAVRDERRASSEARERGIR